MNRTTTALDVVGSLLIVAAVMVAVWTWTPAGALASGGVLLLLLSWLTTRPWTRMRKGRP